MPNFKQKEEELKTRLDKWLYFIKNLEDFQTIPEIFKDKIFIQAFEKSEIAKFGQAELENYEMNLKIYRDYKNTVDTAFDEGKIEGKIEGRIEGRIEGEEIGFQKGIVLIVVNGYKNGFTISQISLLTGLSENEVIIILKQEKIL
jgi:predicted transposase/invertase (TIGR01784 family)